MFLSISKIRGSPDMVSTNAILRDRDSELRLSVDGSHSETGQSTEAEQIVFQTPPWL